jgi:hypothetical protein
MVRRRNDIEVEDVTSTSQYDGLQVLKDAHSLPGHYIRTRESLTLVKPYFDSFSATYDSNNNPLEVCYFAGTKSHITSIGFIDDVNSSLAGDYFIISSGRKEARYAVYYVVDGVGTDPNLSGVTSIRVDIQENDLAPIIAVATQIALNAVYNAFTIRRINSVLEIETKKLGETNNTLDIGTGFTISNDIGENQVVEKVNLEYSSEGNPIWQSEELFNYRYNVYTGRFELIEEITVNLDTLVSKEPEIFNVAMAISGTEYSLTLPVDTKRFSMKIRDNSSKFEVSYISGGDTYSISRGTEYSEEGLSLDTGSITLYFSGNKDNLIMEIITWK